MADFKTLSRSEQKLFQKLFPADPVYPHCRSGRARLGRHDSHIFFLGFSLGRCGVFIDGGYLAKCLGELAEPRIDLYKLALKLARGNEIVRTYHY